MSQSDPDAGAEPSAAAASTSAESAGEPAICSSRGCRQPAVWAVVWNNPKLHTPDRRKVWTACDQHREHLADFLRLRGFLREVRPLATEHSEDAQRSEASEPGHSQRTDGGPG